MLNADTRQTGLDFFISYTGADQAWAEWIAWQLEAADYSVTLQAWDFRPGQDFVRQMDQASQRASRTIAVLSPAYVESDFAEAEWRAAFRSDPTGEHGSLVLVRVAEVTPRGLLGSRIYVDLVGLDAAAARTTLLEGIRPGRVNPQREPPFPGRDLSPPAPGPGRAEEPRFPGAGPAIWNLPPRNPHFTGRRELLEALRASLAASSAAVVDAQTQAVLGHGGVGKSQLALEYAYRFAADYDLVWWIPAGTTVAIPTAFTELAVELDLLPAARQPAGQPADQDAIVAAVLAELRRRPRWLLIFDNASVPDLLTPYRPTRGPGRVLVTSRHPGWDRLVASPLNVDILPRADAVVFLLRRTRSSDQASAEALAEELGDLPLALEQAAAYMRQGSKPMAEYLGSFRRHRAELLALGAPIAYQGTVDTTVRLVISQMSGSSAALELLRWCAFMAPDAIPLDVLTGADDVARLPVSVRHIVRNELAMDQAVAALYGSSLVDRDDNGLLRVHRLVQAVVRGRLAPAAQRTWAERTIDLLLGAFPSSIDELADPARWPRCARLLPHVLAAADRAREAGVGEAPSGELLMHAGSYLQHRGQYAAAQGLLQRALQLVEAARGPDQLEVAHVLNALGYVLRAQGDAEAARAAHERALMITKDARGPDHAEVGSTLNNLGRVLYEQGELASARNRLEQALATSSTALGPDHPEVASTLNNLGRVLYDQDDLMGARAAHERALAIKEADPNFGPDHPSVAITLDYLGRVLSAQGELHHARMVLERARAIQEAALGPDHPDLGHTLASLGAVLLAQGEHDAARAVLERARGIQETVLGPRASRLWPAD